MVSVSSGKKVKILFHQRAISLSFSVFVIPALQSTYTYTHILNGLKKGKINRSEKTWVTNHRARQRWQRKQKQPLFCLLNRMLGRERAKAIWVQERVCVWMCVLSFILSKSWIKIEMKSEKKCRKFCWSIVGFGSVFCSGDHMYTSRCETITHIFHSDKVKHCTILCHILRNTRASHPRPWQTYIPMPQCTRWWWWVSRKY